jgi:hypothetical protein
MQKLRDNHRNVEMARKCLGLIRDIADRGASSWDPNTVGYALQELSQVLLERTGTEDRMFEPISAEEIGDLSALYAELEGRMLSRFLCEPQMSLRSGQHGRRPSRLPASPNPGRGTRTCKGCEPGASGLGGGVAAAYHQEAIEVALLRPCAPSLPKVALWLNLVRRTQRGALGRQDWPTVARKGKGRKQRARSGQSRAGGAELGGCLGGFLGGQ